MRLALFEPEIPQNTGTLMRLGACLGVPLDIIEPCGFVWDDQKLRRAGMDYIEISNVQRHTSWKNFQIYQAQSHSRLVLIDVNAPVSFLDFHFLPTDTLLMGKESSGVPDAVAAEIPLHLHIPMKNGCRSLNMALAAGMILTEALRQTNLFPSTETPEKQKVYK